MISKTRVIKFVSCCVILSVQSATGQKANSAQAAPKPPVAQISPTVTADFDGAKIGQTLQSAISVLVDKGYRVVGDSYGAHQQYSEGPGGEPVAMSYLGDDIQYRSPDDISNVTPCPYRTRIELRGPLSREVTLCAPDMRGRIDEQTLLKTLRVVMIFGYAKGENVELLLQKARAKYSLPNLAIGTAWTQDGVTAYEMTYSYNRGLIICINDMAYRTGKR